MFTEFVVDRENVFQYGENLISFGNPFSRSLDAPTKSGRGHSPDSMHMNLHSLEASTVISSEPSVAGHDMSASQALLGVGGVGDTLPPNYMISPLPLTAECSQATRSKEANYQYPAIYPPQLTQEDIQSDDWEYVS